MSNIVLTGSQWGDEGKGRITDLLSGRMNMVVRFQGGDNAGHTVILNENTFKLHLVPSGILYPDVICVIGNGVVVNPDTLINELNDLKNKNINTDNLRISSNCHLIMPYHIAIDKAAESNLGPLKIGTTKKGIGPAYADKAARCGIRLCDLFSPELFRQKLTGILKIKNAILNKVYSSDGFDVEEIYNNYMEYAEKLKKYVADTTFLVNEALDAGKNILFEGAQGALLDIDHGTYPYVTSSSTISGGVFCGSGIGPKRIDHVIGITKSYCTRVGEGVFPTELFDQTGDYIRDRGSEFGTTTGRARRCGWFDCVLLRYSKMISNFDSIALTKLDVLTGIEKIKICTSYDINGKKHTNVTPDCAALQKSSPVYLEMDGWQEDLSRVRSFEKLPLNAKKYIETLEELLNIPASMVSVGPDRNQIIIRSNELEDFLK